MSKRREAPKIPIIANSNPSPRSQHLVSCYLALEVTSAYGLFFSEQFEVQNYALKAYFLVIGWATFLEAWKERELEFSFKLDIPI